MALRRPDQVRVTVLFESLKVEATGYTIPHACWRMRGKYSLDAATSQAWISEDPAYMGTSNSRWMSINYVKEKARVYEREFLEKVSGMH